MTLQPRSLVLIVVGVALLAWAVGASWLVALSLAAGVAFVLVILTRPMPRARAVTPGTSEQLDDARGMSLANAALWGGLVFGGLHGYGSHDADATSGLDGGADPGGGADVGGFDAGGFDAGGGDGGGGFN